MATSWPFASLAGSDALQNPRSSVAFGFAGLAVLGLAVFGAGWRAGRDVVFGRGAVAAAGRTGAGVATLAAGISAEGVGS